MKKFLEKAHLYFLLYYFAVGDFIVYYLRNTVGMAYSKFNFSLSLILFLVGLIILDIFILIACAKQNNNKTLKPMLAINIYFAFNSYINVPVAFILQIFQHDGSSVGIWEIFSLPFYETGVTDIADNAIWGSLYCFIVLSVINIILLYVNRKHRKNKAQ